MRRTLIQTVLPLVFCCVPVIAGVLIAVSIPSQAREFYLERVIPQGSSRGSPIDWLILGLGGTLFVLQVLLSWSAMQWRGTKFNTGVDKWLNHLAQAAEWFPLLGLLGTVAAILQTFSSITGTVAPEQVIRLYAPAITATGSGLFMALLNIFPTWMVQLGRHLILALSGGETHDDAMAPPPSERLA
jgi:hypothetical protein